MAAHCAGDRNLRFLAAESGECGNPGVLGAAQPLTAPFKRPLFSLCLALELFGTTGIHKRAVPPLLVLQRKYLYLCFALHNLSTNLVPDR